jgi:hypothetical protein
MGNKSSRTTINFIKSLEPSLTPAIVGSAIYKDFTEKSDLILPNNPYYNSSVKLPVPTVVSSIAPGKSNESIVSSHVTQSTDELPSNTLMNHSDEHSDDHSAEHSDEHSDDHSAEHSDEHSEELPPPTEYLLNNKTILIIFPTVIIGFVAVYYFYTTRMHQTSFEN